MVKKYVHHSSFQVRIYKLMSIVIFQACISSLHMFFGFAWLQNIGVQKDVHDSSFHLKCYVNSLKVENIVRRCFVM